MKARIFGGLIDLTRKLNKETIASVEWFISHIGGCLPSYAARTGKTNIDEVLTQLGNDMCLYWFEKDFAKECERRALLMGRQLEDKENEDEEEKDLQLF